jgi:4-alpha-glucanotransferase
MLLHFYIRFHTKMGESLHITGSANALGNNNLLKAVRLSYLNNEFWHGQIKLTGKDLEQSFINYKYIFRTDNGEEVIEWENERIIDLANNKAKEIVLIDTWNHAGDIANVFYTKPFKDVFFQQKKKVAGKNPKIYTHEFKVKAPLLSADEVLFIAGDNVSLGEWNTEAPLLMNLEGNWWVKKIDLTEDGFPVSYKYGIYNTKEKKFARFESGPNRYLPGNGNKGKHTIVHDGFAQLTGKDPMAIGWKGAGVAVPVFSLRTKKSFGTGEFTDIKVLVDWAKITGLKLIQLLPINDTTATHTRADSYPYAAISAFALHPLYLNIEAIASGESAALKAFKKKQKELNALAEVDYVEVMKFKLAAIKEIYASQKTALKKDKDYTSFIEENKEWLIPYAAFSYLRDKYKTPDSSKWETHSEYDAKAIDKMVQPTSKQYDEIAIHYFIQYHLHLQLKDATDYAHKNGVVVKGDLPIGVYRYGCDAWVNPSLYNMNAQAGAPPDAFAVKGQNWGFPTYNWQKMQEDGFSWWRNRFKQMEVYFDAFRIDHILGFFRIWSIPLNAVEGILGRFVPAIPIHKNEFLHNHIDLNADRFCKPFINEEVLNEVFNPSELEYVKEHYLKFTDGVYKLKPAYATQRKVEEHFEVKPITEEGKRIKQGLFDLISNVILLEEPGSKGSLFHFRISMEQTSSYKQLDNHTKQKLWELYVNYFYYRQDSMWEKKAMQKLPNLKRSTNMLVCGEDLGMVPHCVPHVMDSLGILGLEIQRMPKAQHVTFTDLTHIPYMSVVTPATHDMSTIRGWWTEDEQQSQFFYNHVLGHAGVAPVECDVTINKEIVLQHLYSPAMWSIFQIQDLLGMDEKLRRADPNEERINIPADPHHYWKYRMHLNLEDLIKEKTFNEELKMHVADSGR